VRKSKQPFGRVEYAAMTRSGVVSHVEEWSKQPCKRVEYAAMKRSGIVSHVKE
jgi:hypothetical protein